MPKIESQESLFQRLTRLFRSGPVVKRKIRTADTVIAVPDKEKSSGAMLFQKSLSPTYATITGNAYNLSERLMRYQDFVEMEYTPEIASALDIYADEVVAQDERGRSLHIYADNPRVKEILEDLFYNVLNVEFNLRSWSRNLVKYGDVFLYNDVSPSHGVINAFPIPVNEIEREENYDRNDPFAVRFRWVSMANRILENWEIAHMRLLGNDMFLPYGSSLIEPARRIWRQLILIEDAMLVYRVVRAPERRVFYIDVGAAPVDEIPRYLEEAKKTLRSNQVIDREKGRVDLRYNPLSVDEDYFIPTRGAETGTKIETLAGGQNAAAVEDVQYIQKKLFSALKVPKAYLGYDEMLSSKATLAQEDIRFSRTINVIQRTVIAELNKIAMIHLFTHGYEGEELTKFNLRLSNPSTIAQQQKLELYKSRFDIAGAAPEGMLSKTYIRKEILGLTDEQIVEIDKQRFEDKISDAQIESAKPEESPAETPEEAPAEETPAEEAPPEEATGEEPVTAGDDVADDAEPEAELLLTADDGKPRNGVPISPNKHIQRMKYNASRRRIHGASKTHIPNFKKMLDVSNDSVSDPYDKNWLKSAYTNPLAETSMQATKPSPDMLSMLKKMSDKLGMNGYSTNRSILREELEIPGDYILRDSDDEGMDD